MKQMNSLFDEWKVEQGQDKSFIKDGIPFPEIYCNQPQKILFILKEPHDELTVGDGDQVEDYQRYSLNQSNNDYGGVISRIGALYSSIWGDGIGDRESIRRIAFMNLKKSGGASSCSEKNLKEYCFRHRKRIREQIDIINPDYIVCLGCFNVFVRSVLLERDPSCRRSWKRENVGYTPTEPRYEYKIPTDDTVKCKLIFSMHHPKIRGMGKEKYVSDFVKNHETVMRYSSTLTFHPLTS